MQDIVAELDAKAYRTDPDAQRKITELHQKNNELTRMLCSLLRTLDGNIALSKDVRDWYTAHRE